MKRCTRCILPDNYPDIKYDQKGVCHKCQEADKKYLNRDMKKLGVELQSIVDWAKAQNKRYDAIVPFSGGKDSSYTMYVLRRKYGMKVLAVNFNNGLRTLEALKNIEKIIQRLDTGFVCYGPNWELMKRLYRQFVLKTGQFCFPCDMGIWATVHRVAEQYDVPLIVSGFSAQIESRGPKIYSYSNKLFRAVASEVATERELQDFLEETSIQKIARRFKHGTWKRYRRQISLPEYMIWDDKVIKDTCANELGWERRPDGTSDHIDCLFAPMKNYLVVQKWGFGEKTTKFAAMVRTGEMKRDDAIAKAEAEESKDVSPALDTFMKTLNLSKREVEEAKNRSHLNYL